MSKYTAEQVRDWHREMVTTLNSSDVLWTGAWAHALMADAIDALLRERESAKAVDPVAVIGPVWQLLWCDPDPISTIANKRGLKIGDKLYAAPMLASARVPDGCFVALTEPTEEQVAETVYNINRKTAADTVTPDMVRQIWNGMVHARPIKQVNAMLAASPKPETIWPKNAREKAFSLAREMLKKGSAKPEKE